MRGFPLLQAILVALGMAVLWGPLSATMHSGLERDTVAPSIDGDGPPTINSATETLPVRLHAQWSRTPKRLLIEIENEPWVDWQEDSGSDQRLAAELTHLAEVPWHDQALDVWVEVEWAGGAGREALEVRLEPEGLEARTLVLWGEADAADGATLSWRPEQP